MWWTDRSITAVDIHTDLPWLIPATPPRFPWLTAGKAQVSETRDQQGRERASRGREGSTNIQKILPSVAPVTGSGGSVGVGGGRGGVRSTDTELSIGWTVATAVRHRQQSKGLQKQHKALSSHFQWKCSTKMVPK